MSHERSYTVPTSELAVDFRDQDHGVLGLVFHRERKRNAITRAMRNGMKVILAEAANDDAVRAVTITGAGLCFSAGFDAGESVVGVEGKSVSRDALYTERYSWRELIWDFQKPVIAGVQSYCLGGAVELVSLCDLCICAEDAIFGWPEVRGGGMPVTAWPYMLPMRRVKEYLLTGRTFAASEALDIGLVNRVTAPEDLAACLGSLARTVAALDVGQLVALKRALNGCYENMSFRKSQDDMRARWAAQLDNPSSKEFWQSARRDGLATSLQSENLRPEEYWRIGRNASIGEGAG